MSRLLWTLLVCCLSLTWGTASAQVTITPTAATTETPAGANAIFYIDAGASTALLGTYVSYKITNTGTTTIPDVWVGISGFTGGIVSLAPNEDGLMHLGALAPGAANARTAFFYLQASALTTVDQVHTVTVYPTRPPLVAPTTALLATNFAFTSVDSTIEAAANKVTSTLAGPNPAVIGGTMVMTVKGDTGTIGTDKILNFTPASYLNWRADVYELVSSKFTLPDASVVTDQLYIRPYGGAGGAYTLEYTFRAVGSSTAPTSVSPVGYISSGAQVKHTSTGTFASLAPIQPATNALTLSKLASPTSGPPGSTVTYTLRLTNSGTINVSADALVDTLPTTPGSPTYVAGSSTFAGAALGNPTISGAQLTWTDTFMVPAGTSRDLTFRVTIPATEGAYVNRAVAQVGSTQIDTTLSTADDAPASVTVNIGTPDLSITKAHAGNFTQGQLGATYTLTARNSGTADTSGTVTVTDTLPAGLSATAISGTGWACTLGTLSCTRTDALVPGASYPAITVTVNVASNAPTSVTNTAAVSGGGQTNTSNDTASDPTTITPATPDMTITKTHTGNFAQTQTGATYTLTATNSGTSSTSGAVTVTDTLPASLTATAISGTGWTCSLGTLSCTRSDALAAGASYPIITLAVNVAANAPTSVTNTAAVSGGGQAVTTNDTASDPTTITVTPPDLTLSKTHTGDFTVGQSARFTFTLNNIAAGTAIATITVTDTLPAGLSLPNGAVTLTGANAVNWSCSSSSNTVTCTSTDNILGGGSSTFDLTGIVVGGAAVPSVTNTASVSTPGEAATGNNSTSDTATVLAPDLTVTKTHVGNFTAGGTGGYTITATNSGSAPTSGTVSLTDTLPSGMSATAINGVGWTCTLGTLTCTRSDSLGTGTSYPAIDLTVNIAANSLGTLTNVVTVSGGGQVNTSNDTAGDPTTVVPGGMPDLTLAKSHTGPFFQGQTGATYTLTATNSGTAPVSGAVTVTDTLPAGLSATAISGSGWTCTLGTLSCTRSDALAAGSSYPPITLNVDVAANAPTSVTNTAAVSGGGQTDTTNDSATDPTTIDPRYIISGTVYIDSSANGQPDSGEAGLPGVTLTLRGTGGTVLASTSTTPDGHYNFPLLSAGSYLVTETQPPGLVSTSPDSVNVIVSSASVQNVSFGEFAGAKVTGQVFRDDGWGATASQANDALQNGTETGIGSFTVMARNGGGVVSTARTDGSGRYTLFLPASAGSVTVLASPTPSHTATGVNDGSVARHLATDSSDPLASRSTVDASSEAGQTLTRNFGLVPQLNLTPDSAQAVTSPGSVIYRQRLTPGTPGTLALAVTPSAGSVFTSQLWHDVNSNGQIDPGSDTPLGLGGNLTLSSSSPRHPDGTLADLHLLLSVSAPAGIASGQSDPARITVTQTLANLGALIRTDSVTDTTTTGAGGLKLSKFVRNVSTSTRFSATSAEGQTGDTLEYCINYQNLGARLLQAAVLTDPVPFFTAVLDEYGAASGVRHVPGTLVSADQTTTPGVTGDNLSSAADADAGTLAPRLLTVELGDLAGGARGTVCYRVEVQ